MTLFFYHIKQEMRATMRIDCSDHSKFC